MFGHKISGFFVEANLTNLPLILRHPIIVCVITADEALAELTLHAFEKCDVDGVYGISWKEVMECEEEFCEKLNILCPTHQEFQSFDQNEDGILTLEEYFDQI